MAYLNGKKIMHVSVDGLYKEGYNDGVPIGFASGQSIGRMEGKEAERTAFWERFQLGGKRVYYNYCFSNDSWNDDIYHPLYPIVSKNANAIFQQASITDTQVPVDLSGCGTSTAYTTFDACTKLKTIYKLIVPVGLQYNNVFRNCTALENITIEGTIGNSVSFGDSPLLTAESMYSIVMHLEGYTPSDDRYGKNTLTVSSAAWQRLEDSVLMDESMYNVFYTWENYINFYGWDLVLT